MSNIDPRIPQAALERARHIKSEYLKDPMPIGSKCIWDLDSTTCEFCGRRFGDVGVINSVYFMLCKDTNTWSIELVDNECTKCAEDQLEEEYGFAYKLLPDMKLDEDQVYLAQFIDEDGNPTEALIPEIKEYYKKSDEAAFKDLEEWYERHPNHPRPTNE